MEDEGTGVSFAVTVAYGENAWQVRSFRDDFTDPQVAVDTVRNLRSEGAAFALLCVDDDYFVIVRPHPARDMFLLSDATMAVDDDFAADILDELEADVPDLDPEELDDIDGWPDGDFDVLEDLGLSEEVLGVLADDQEAWPSEQLMRIAEELGFGEELAEATGLER